MEINESEAENSLARHIDENHNYFQIAMEPVNILIDNNNIQLHNDGENEMPNLVPSNSTEETSKMHEEIQTAKPNNADIPQKEKTGNKISDDEEVNETSASSNDDEPLANMLKNSGKGKSNEMIWKHLRPMFPCNKCSYGAKKKYLLLRHLKTHYKDLKSTGWYNKETLNKPGVDVKLNDEELTVLELAKRSKKDDEGIDNVNKDELQRAFACNECSYNTNKRYLLLRHAKTHSGDWPHKCKICERSFTTGASLQGHIHTHYGMKHQICKYCKKSFTSSSELNRHVKYKHTHEKPHKCTECDYGAVERNKLLRHIQRYHTGERPSQCQHCTYASQDTRELRRHLRTHAGEKPYKCRNCNAIFPYSTSLKLHKHTHHSTETKLYSCELCPAKNERESQLRLHIKRMHYSDKLLECRRCGETFPDRYTYRLHNKTNSCAKCFKCQLCSFSGKKFKHLKTHMNVHNREQPIDSKSFTVANNC